MAKILRTEYSRTATDLRPNSLLHQALTKTGIQPLRLSLVTYGSPASFDFLGLGKVLEILLGTVKDLRWRDKHVEHMAALERRSKEIEIETAEIERQAKEVQLAETRLALQKSIVEFASERLQLMQSIRNVYLPEEDRVVLESALSLKMLSMIEAPIFPEAQLLPISGRKLSGPPEHL